jgi:hypothetical protein
VISDQSVISPCRAAAVPSRIFALPRIAIFQEILDYIHTHDASHLRHHLKLIEEMTAYLKTTGWNRYSQFVALALASGELDYARQGLSVALSWLVGQPLKDADVNEAAMNLARVQVAPVASRNPGPIEIGVHLAMWGQYEWALYALWSTGFVD